MTDAGRCASLRRATTARNPSPPRIGLATIWPNRWTGRTRGVLGQGEIRPYVVVVGSIGLEDPAQMVLAQDHDVVQALPADRADQPFRMSFCLRCYQVLR